MVAVRKLQWDGEVCFVPSRQPRLLHAFAQFPASLGQGGGGLFEALGCGGGGGLFEGLGIVLKGNSRGNTIFDLQTHPRTLFVLLRGESPSD